MDLYFVKILDQQKIKVGISENAKKRIVTIQNAGGYPDNQIYSNIFHNSGQFESTLKVLFKDYQIKGEWFEYKGLVEFFHKKIQFENKIDLNMIRTLPKKFLNSIDFNLDKESQKIEKTIQKQQSDKGILVIKGDIFNLSKEELEMIKKGETVYLYDNFVDFFNGKTFITWEFEDKRHIVQAFLKKLSVEFKRL